MMIKDGLNKLSWINNIYLIVLSIALFSSALFAQTIERKVISSGGTVLNGGGYQVSVTAGQTAGSTLTSGAYQITQGFQQPEREIITLPVSTPLCAGVTINVPFVANGIGVGNVFTAQLSNASGSFVSPVNIGTLNGNTSGTINAVIPAGVAFGVAYRIRVISSLPVVIGKDNGTDLFIEANPNLTITAPLAFCSGTPVQLQSASNIQGNALQFDGVNDYAMVNNSGVSLANTSFTIECWAKRNSITTDDIIFSQGLTGATNQLLNVGFTTSAVRFGFYGNGIDVPHTADLNWHHYAFTFDNNTMQRLVYKDGVQIGQNSSTSSFLFTGNTNLHFGYLVSSSLVNFDGQLDEFRIWNTVRTPAQIQSNMNLAIAPDASGLAACFKFDDTPGSVSNGFFGMQAALTNGAIQVASTAPLQLNSYAWLPGGVTTPSINITPANNTTYNLTATTANGCVSNASQAVVVTPVQSPAISINITLGSQIICAGTTVSFNAVATNGGAAPVYQWVKNGTNVGTNNSTYTDAALANNDVISCILTSNSLCTNPASVTSAGITITVKPQGEWLGLSSNWQAATNWCGGVPTSLTNVQITNAVPFQPVLNANAFCNNLFIDQLATVKLNNNTITINGAISGNGEITGSPTSSVSIEGTGNAGTLRMADLNAGEKSLFDLTLNRPGATLALADTLYLYNTMHILNGTFQSNNKLRLKSNALNTARIAPVNSGAAFIGDITAERFAPGGLTGWALLGSPVINATIKDWTDPWPTSGFPTSGFAGATGYAGGFVSVYTYQESTPGLVDYGYLPATSVANPLVNGTGFYTYLGTGAATTADINFKVYGTPFIGNKNFAVSYTVSSAGLSEDGWNLIANPYPCEIDWLSANWTKANMDDAIYIYNADVGNMASYVAGVSVNGGSPYIASHQGFFVKANAINPTLVSVENVKTLTNPALLRNSPIGNDYAVFGVKLSSKENVFTDECKIRFNGNSGTGFNKTLEAYKIYAKQKEGVHIMSMDGKNELAVNALQELKSTSVIPLKVKISKAGSYVLNFENLASVSRYYSNLFATHDLVIEDVNNKSEDILETDLPYAFVVEENDAVRLFNLRFSQKLNEAGASVATNLQVKNLEGNCYVLADFPENTAVAIYVRNAAGQEVKTPVNTMIKKGTIKVDSFGLAKGIYLVTVVANEVNLSKRFYVE